MKYRSVFNAWNNPLFLIDQETMTIQDVNDAGCQAYGYFRNELVGKNILDLCIEPETIIFDIKKIRRGSRGIITGKRWKSIPGRNLYHILGSRGYRPVFVYAV